jgi:alcohol dehydrogenase class IV
LDYELKNKKIGLMLGEISDHMNFANLDADWYHKAQTCVKHIIEFTRSLGTPKTLNEIQKDITPLQVKKLSLKAMKDFCGISNPIQLSKKQVMHIYRNAITGTFDNLSK